MDHKSVGPVKYVLAVSGGIDSVVLLHIMAARFKAGNLTVAHLDHGIRVDSGDDRLFVQRLARMYGLEFAYREARLGSQASEAAAREARYGFLRQVKEGQGATHIVTAHHQDDVLETAILNLLRGTGRKGLSSLRSQDDLYRPLLTTPKHHIRQYARRHHLHWHEDSTNADPDYLRNYVRQRIMPSFDAAARDQLLQISATISDVNCQIDGLLAEQLHGQPSSTTLERQWFVMLPHIVAREIMAAWLRSKGIGVDRRSIERLVAGAKTLMAGKRLDISGEYMLLVQKDYLVLVKKS